MCKLEMISCYRLPVTGNMKPGTGNIAEQYLYF